MKAQWQKLRQHPWLGQALLAIVVILLLNTVFLVQDTNNGLARTCTVLYQRVQSMAAIDGQQEWFKRRKEVSSRLAQLQSRLWQAPTPALAQANVQDKLNMLIRQNGLDSARLQVGSLLPVAGAPLGLIKAKLDFRLDPAKLPLLLAKIQRLDPKVQIDGLDFQDRPGTRVVLDLNIYFRKQD